MRTSIRMLSILCILFLTAGCFSKETDQAVTQNLKKVSPPSSIKKEREEPVDDGEKSMKSLDEPSSKEGEEIAAPSPKEPSGSKNDSASLPKTVSPQEVTSPSVTEEQVKKKYLVELTDLQNYYVVKLSGLQNQAMDDLKSGKSAKSLYTEYAKQGISISEESQAQVNQLLFQMKAELKANQMTLDSVDQLRSIYNAEIEQAKNESMQKVKQALGLK